MTGHTPLDVSPGHALRCSCGHFITHTRDSYLAAQLRHAEHVKHATKTGSR
jgi:hypothetical protein